MATRGNVQHVTFQRNSAELRGNKQNKTTTETQFKTTRSKSKRCKAKQTSATRTNATQNPEHQRKSEHIRSGITGANYVYSSALGRACAMEGAGRNPPTAYLQRWTASEQLIATSQPTAVTFHNQTHDQTAHTNCLALRAFVNPKTTWENALRMSWCKRMQCSVGWCKSTSCLKPHVVSRAQKC